MNAHEESNLERPPEAEAERAQIGGGEPAEPAASRDEPADKPASTIELLGGASKSEAAGEGAPSVEPPRLHLVRYEAPPRGEAAGGPSSAARWASGLAAGLALLAAVTGVGLYDHARQSNLLAAKAEESRDLAQTVKNLKDRIDAVEAARTRDETADLHKVAAEMKTQSGAARDLSAALAQLTARVDRIDHDQSARLDKLADRIDHESAARIADLATRLDKLEKRPPAAVLAVAPSPKPAAAAAKPDPVVSNETTGSIDKSAAPLRGYWLVDVEDGFAIVDGRDGPQQVAPGDLLPGAGRVQRIERRGHEWVVVTSAGIIVGDRPRF